MKILSFSAVEILPALLSKAKVQTIRLAWKEVMPEFTKHFTEKIIKPITKKAKLVYVQDKPARFKIGEKFQLMWKNRGMPKDAKFCKTCGVLLHPPTSYPARANWFDCPLHGWQEGFSKFLGTATITEVFQIEMSRDSEFGVYFLDGIARDAGRQKAAIKNLALKDGFEDVYAMLHYFDSHYDLSSPKKFWCYRWRWE